MNTLIIKNAIMEPEDISTRNAVETSIDLSKSDASSTWESMATKARLAIKPWKAIVRDSSCSKRLLSSTGN